MSVLVLSYTTGYQLRSFDEAARSLGIELIFATDRCHQLDDPWQDRAIAVRFHEPESSMRAVLASPAAPEIDGVIAVGDRPVVTAARVAEALGLSWHRWPAPPPAPTSAGHEHCWLRVGCWPRAFGFSRSPRR